MRILARGSSIALAALWLAACNTTGDLAGQSAQETTGSVPAGTIATAPLAPPTGNEGAAARSDGDAKPEAPDPATTGTVPPPLGVPAAAETPGLLGSDPNDELSLGKKHYRAANYGLAEQHFRKAVELHPRDAEAWLGLAASYDRLRRFDLADRAYAQAIRIVGETVEILNNQGFSYMLRGDFRRARAKLLAARRKDPGNKYVANNLHLLEESVRLGKQVE
jgi:tetratricopeptide (TPR) repeat protein